MSIETASAAKAWETDRHHLEGLLAFPLTAFDAHLDLDLDGLSEGIERHVDGEAGALFLACGTGEFSALSPDEQGRVLSRGLEVTHGRVPVWAGAGGGAAQARAGVAAAQELGADGVLLMPPYLVTGPPHGLLDYVRYAVGTSSIPVIVYHRGTAVFTDGAAVDLLDIPSVIGLKDGHGSVELMNRIVTRIRDLGTARGDAFLFFNGLPTAEVSAPAYSAIGVERYSSAVHCFAPEIASAFFRALEDGDDATTQRSSRGSTCPWCPSATRPPGSPSRWSRRPPGCVATEWARSARRSPTPHRNSWAGWRRSSRTASPP